MGNSEKPKPLCYNPHEIVDQSTPERIQLGQAIQCCAFRFNAFSHGRVIYRCDNPRAVKEPDYKFCPPLARHSASLKK